MFTLRPSRTSSTAIAHIESSDRAGRHVLVVETGDEVVRFAVDGTPSFLTARLFAVSVRRIHGVTFCCRDGRWTASAEVTGHRLPQRRSISVATALALALTGHHVGVCTETIESGGTVDGRLSL